MNNSITITTAHSQFITVNKTDIGVSIDLLPDIPSNPTHLNRVLRQNLQINESSLPVTGPLELEGEQFDLFLVMNERVHLAGISATPTSLNTTVYYQLSPLEARFLARNKQLLPGKELPEDIDIETDLHTHFAGCVYAEDLLRIGVENNTTYPSHLLDEAGVHGYCGDVTLKSLPKTVLEILRDQMQIPLDRQITFVLLEKIYKLRSPLTKSLNNFIPLLEQIASDYASFGVSYCEISFTDIVNSERLELLKKHLHSIEKKSGVKIRFLAAIGRSDDPEWDLDYINRLKELQECHWIVGVDFLGHELNSTKAIANHIQSIAEWAHLNRPGYVIRVHAGENPAHPENIRVALESIAGKNVTMRIGHGIYGGDRRTVHLLKKENALVEFNINSNFALNNIHDCGKLPLEYYINLGIQVVLGTDGYGIYQTSSIQEVKAALLAGLNREQLQYISETEKRYRFCVSLKEEKESCSIPGPMSFSHFTEEVINRRINSVSTQKEKLINKLKSSSIKTVSYRRLLKEMKVKNCISIAGAWKNSWNSISSADKEKIKELLKRFLSSLDRENSLIITGGTSFGLEGLVHSLAQKSGHSVMGTLVNDIDLNSIDSRLHSAHIIADQFYNKAAQLYTALEQCKGWAIFIGGGDIVADEIQTVHNLGVPYLLMNGPAGAATDFCKYRPQNAFTSSEELISAVKGENSWNSTEGNYWHVGVNPTVDAVITRINEQTGNREILLIKRRADALTESGKWALPGGFIHTDAPNDTPWREGFESAKEACLRELREETLLDLRNYIDDLKYEFTIENPGRDPRDTEERWSRSSIYSMVLSKEIANSPICGNDDAEEAFWCELSDLPWNMAFDHKEIIESVLGRG